jgi:hypothetical protein
MVRAMSTPEHWGHVEFHGKGVWAACLLELRARVEALEREAAMTELRAASAEVRPAPASSLVERVAKGIGSASPWMHSHRDEARAAIREVAAWLRDRGGYPWAWVAQTLGQEANR